MNLNEAKSLFFAQYLRQPLFITQGTAISPNDCIYSPGETACYLDGVVSNKIVIGYIAENRYDIFAQAVLLLRSIEMLSDEEKINVAALVCARHNRHYNEQDISYKIHDKHKFDIILIVKSIARYHVQITNDGCAFIDHYMGGAGTQHYYCPGQYVATDYMRSIGILLPFTYLNDEQKPITLQPDEIIKLGWAKIIEPEQK